jgi:hypothetical protein
LTVKEASPEEVVRRGPYELSRWMIQLVPCPQIQDGPGMADQG